MTLLATADITKLLMLEGYILNRLLEAKVPQNPQGALW